jgi:heat shock protein HslJ
MKNNNSFIPSGLICVSVLMILACATSEAAGIAEARSATAPSQENQPTHITDIQGKDWVLEEIRTNAATVLIDRPDNTEAFTIMFEADRVGGVGFPNRYFGPYTAGEGNSLSIGMMASTMMMALFEIEGLNEREYFAYLSKVTSWNVQNGKLELATSGENGEAAVLVFQ